VTVFIVVGVVGLLLLILSLVLDDFLDGVLEGIDFTGGYLSTSAIAAFMAAFGLVGALWMGQSDSLGQSVLAGAAAGLAMGGIAGWVTRVMVHSPTDRTPSPTDAVGASGVVITAIPEGGFGEVNIRLAGAPLKLNARASRPLAVGTEVVVVASLSATSVRVEESSV
jgi:hypothetical protein